MCYELKSLGLNKRTTLVLSNTRELNRDPFITNKILTGCDTGAD